MSSLGVADPSRGLPHSRVCLHVGLGNAACSVTRRAAQRAQDALSARHVPYAIWASRWQWLYPARYRELQWSRTHGPTYRKPPHGGQGLVGVGEASQGDDFSLSLDVMGQEEPSRLKEGQVCAGLGPCQDLERRDEVQLVCGSGRPVGGSRDLGVLSECGSHPERRGLWRGLVLTRGGTLGTSVWAFPVVTRTWDISAAAKAACWAVWGHNRSAQTGECPC